jgi:hypothetical protein
MAHENQAVPDYINYNNGAQFPSIGGGLYIGQITAVGSDLRCSVAVGDMSLTLHKIRFLNATKSNPPKNLEAVVVGFLGHTIEEAIIIGRLNVSADIFATKVTVASLQAQVTSLAQRVTTLENA